MNGKKIQVILLLYHKDESVTNFNEKVELFNSFSVKQCSLISNNRTLSSKL